MELICLAGNHSSWAALELLKLTSGERFDKYACDVSDNKLKFRPAWLFCRSELNDEIVHILQGMSFHTIFKVEHIYIYCMCSFTLMVHQATVLSACPF